MAANLYVEEGYVESGYIFEGIYVFWSERRIFIPKLTMVKIQTNPSEIYELDLNFLRLELKDLEDNVDGIVYPSTHNHNTTVTVGGVTLARVLEIINGYTVEFEDARYAVNLKGANTNVGDVTVVNGVSIRPSNSAGLQDLSTILASAYNNEVAVNTESGQAGTSIPLGTRGTPVNNFKDARTIADNNSLSVIQILNSTTLSEADYSEGYIIRGDSPATVSLTVEPEANIESCTFENITVQGTMDGNNTFNNCNINNVDYTNGFIYQCALNGVVTLGGFAQCSILDSWSNMAGAGEFQYPVIDMGGSGNSLALRNYSGGVGIRNYSGGGAVSIDMNSGRVVIEGTVTDGTLIIRGVADVVDMSTGTAVVIDETVNTSIDNLPDNIFEGQVPETPTVGSWGEFIKDKLLTTFKFNAFK